MMKKQAFLGILLLSILLTSTAPPPAYAGRNDGYLVRGVGKVLFSVLEIPSTMIEHSKEVIFPVGIVTGAVVGTVKTVTGIVSGAVDIATGALPYAKYALFFI